MKKTITIEIEVPNEATAAKALSCALTEVLGVRGVMVLNNICRDTHKPFKGSKMRLHVLMVQHEVDSSPEVVRCWDEYCRDGNPDGYDEDMASGRKQYGDSVEYRQVVIRTVGLPEVFDTPEIAGEIE